MIHTKRTIRLNKRDTALYEDPGERGDNFRAKVKRAVQDASTAVGHPIEIHSNDGIVLEQILPEES